MNSNRKARNRIYASAIAGIFAISFIVLSGFALGVFRAYAVTTGGSKF